MSGVGRVIRELLEFISESERQAEPMDINATVRRVTARVAADGFHGVLFRLDLDPHLRPLLGNPLQAEKVLVNLVENSIEAMCEAGVIERAITVVVCTSARHRLHRRWDAAPPAPLSDPPVTEPSNRGSTIADGACGRRADFPREASNAAPRWALPQRHRLSEQP